MKFTLISAPTVRKNPLLARMVNCLSQLDFRVLVDAPELARRLKVAPNYVSAVKYLIPESLSIKSGRRRFYGNAKTVRAWKKRYLRPER
jgi:hypothetical protein